MKTLRQKHPNAKPSNDTMMLQGPFNQVNKITFDGINLDLVTECAIRTKGSHELSGVNADFWSKIQCNSTFGNASDELCHAIALLLRMLCSEKLVNPKSMEGLVECRLISLDKSPGVRTLGIMPLLTSIISNNTGNLIHIVFADDLTDVGQIHELTEWWKNVLHYGPYLGYYINESKSWLIMKEEYIQIAKETFRDYNRKITTDGHRPLGVVVGSNKSKEVFVIEKVSEWVKQLEILTKFACTEPHAAFPGFIHGLRHRYTYFIRTIPGISHLLKPQDNGIDTFIKVLLQAYTLSPTERVLFSLPAKYSEMGLIISSEICQEEFSSNHRRNNQ